MRNVENKYITFFHKSKKNEKNTYAGFIPNKIWSLIVDSENEENFAKIGVESAIQKYFDNKEFSIKNMNEILNFINKKINENKIRKNMDFNKNFSATTVLIKDNIVIIGNTGKNKVKIFNENEIIVEIEGNTIEKINLYEKDYILIGSEIFWEIFEKEKILKIIERNDNKIEVENQISKIVEKFEMERDIVIPFFTIFVEKLENKNEIENEHQIFTESLNINPMKYLLIFLIFITSLTAITKNINDYEENKIVKSKKIEKENKVLEEKISNVEDDKNIVNIEKNNKIIELKQENKENLEESEKKQENKKINEAESIKNIEKSKDKKIVSNIKKENNIKKKKRKFKKIKKNKKSEKRKSIVKVSKNRNVNKLKKINKTENSLEKLEREIKENWRKLGRDKNGNVIN